MLCGILKVVWHMQISYDFGNSMFRSRKKTEELCPFFVKLDCRVSHGLSMGMQTWEKKFILPTSYYSLSIWVWLWEFAASYGWNRSTWGFERGKSILCFFGTYNLKSCAQGLRVADKVGISWLSLPSSWGCTCKIEGVFRKPYAT